MTGNPPSEHTTGRYLGLPTVTGPEVITTGLEGEELEVVSRAAATPRATPAPAATAPRIHHFFLLALVARAFTLLWAMMAVPLLLADPAVEHGARPGHRQLKHYLGVRNRLAGFIEHLDPRRHTDTGLDIVLGAFALEYHDLQLPRLFLGRRRGRRARLLNRWRGCRRHCCRRRRLDGRLFRRRGRRRARRLCR